MTASKVVLYFDNQEDALLFTLAASSVLSEDGRISSKEDLLKLAQEIGKATRITTQGALEMAGLGADEPSRVTQERRTA
jgi:hypothetical protein